jgi:hypothetical protein
MLPALAFATLIAAQFAAVLLIEMSDFADGVRQPVARRDTGEQLPQPRSRCAR